MNKYINYIREIPTERKSKIALWTIVIILIIAALFAAATVYERKNSNIGEITFFDSYEDAKSEGICIDMESCSGFKSHPYIVSTGKHGPIFKGYLYGTEKAAILNPLVIDGNGEKIVIAVDGRLYAYGPGESAIIRTSSYTSLYLVVV